MSVQREMMTEELEQERPWEAHAWLRAETLAALAELNEQCLDMLVTQFSSRGAAPARHGPRCAPSRGGLSLSFVRRGFCRSTAVGVGVRELLQRASQTGPG